jgi:hypothetical protein
LSPTDAVQLVVCISLSSWLVPTLTSAFCLYTARSSWGPVNVYCFNFIIKSQTYLHDAPLAVRQMLLRWTIALPYLLRSHVLDYKPGADSLEELLTDAEVCLFLSFVLCVVTGVGPGTQSMVLLICAEKFGSAPSRYQMGGCHLPGFDKRMCMLSNMCNVFASMWQRAWHAHVDAPSISTGIDIGCSNIAVIAKTAAYTVLAADGMRACLLMQWLLHVSELRHGILNQPLLADATCPRAVSCVCADSMAAAQPRAW